MSSDSRYPKWQNNQSPPQAFIRKHNKMEKSNFKKQFTKWLRDPNFEIIEQRHSRSACWDWN